MNAVLKAPVRWLGTLTDRIVFLIGAVVGAQVPGFIAHYRQRLGGHLDEAQRNLGTYQDMANDLTAGDLQALINRFAGSVEEGSVRTAEIIRDNLARVEELNEAATALASTSGLSKFYQFITHVDLSIARGTLGDYVMNVPVNLEGILYALTGGILLGLFYHGLLRGGQRLGQRWPKTNAPPPAFPSPSDAPSAPQWTPLDVSSPPKAPPSSS